jgi:hypothetical protein
MANSSIPRFFFIIPKVVDGVASAIANDYPFCVAADLKQDKKAIADGYGLVAKEVLAVFILARDYLRR